jgi:hypothetical protein
MSRKKTLLSTSVGLAAILILTSCGPSQAEIDATSTRITAELFANQTADAPTSTPIPTRTPTAIPPTATSIPPTVPPTQTLETLPGLVPEGIVVTFKKNETCTISGPTELPAGEYTFILMTQGDILGFLHLSYPIDGKTTQDFLNHPNRNDGHWWAAALELIDNTIPIDAWINESRNERYYTYSLDEGEHLVIRWNQNPHFFWFCDSIWVK